MGQLTQNHGGPTDDPAYTAPHFTVTVKYTHIIAAYTVNIYVYIDWIKMIKVHI